MNIPYRTRRALRSLGIFLLSVLLVGILVWLIWLLWLDRYVVYSRDGVRFDFDLPSASLLQGEVAEPPGTQETVSIYFNDGSYAINTSTDLTQVYGYYLDSTILQSRDLNEIKEILRALPAETTILLDVKNGYGDFYYTSEVGRESTSVDTAAMDDLIYYLRTSGFYTVARVSALRDYYFGLNNVSSGLEHSNGGYLYADENNCYWLNPESSATINYLISIAAELKNKGFNEVVFAEFQFPNTSYIRYRGDRSAALSTAAATLVSNCATETFAVSFVTDLVSFTLPQGRCRAYVRGVSASQAAVTAENSGLATPDIHLVFLTEAKDTRFDNYGVLRPITSAKIDD